MPTATPPERNFVVFVRGEQREDLLASFRNGLRLMINPETGQPFTEQLIQIATARKSRWYVEADALDLVLLAGQQRALYGFDQTRYDRAGDGFLYGVIGPLWGEDPLLATGGSGPAGGKANPGTLVTGSTILGDPLAIVLTDPTGKRFQVLVDAIADGSGNLVFDVQGIDTGDATNLAAGTKLTWSNPPLGVVGNAEVTADFTGGIGDETSAQYAKRIMDRVKRKPGAGNSAHYRSWARDSSNAVEDAFIYPCAFHAGSVLVVPTQKRGKTVGPLARIPSVGTLAQVTNYLVPPGSPVVPVPPHVVVVPPVAQATDLTMALAMPKGRSSGWNDLAPWPVSTTAVTITTLTDQTHFRVTTTSSLPPGVSAPSLMVWNDATSRFEQLFVTSVVDAGSNHFDVVLAATPSKTLVVGDYISPFTKRATLIAEAAESYFDALGPGEVIDLSSDLRSQRAFRFPEPVDDFPQNAGAAILATEQDALGASLSTSVLEAISATTPALPAQVINGPSMLTLGKLAIYPV